MDKTELQQRIEYLLKMGETVRNTSYQRAAALRVDNGHFTQFRTSSLSFIGGLFGTDSIYYKDFDSRVEGNYLSHLNAGIVIINSIKDEVTNGWLQSYQSLLRAEVFSSFLEMSNHLIEEG